MRRDVDHPIKAAEQFAPEAASADGAAQSAASERWILTAPSADEHSSTDLLSKSELGSRNRVVEPEWVREFYEKSEAAEFGLTPEEFAGILKEIGARYLSPADVHPPATTGSDGQPARQDDLRREERMLYAGLRLQELALARACAKGVERAWEVFLIRYREKLYAAALSITREESAGRELADSLYADLFGMAKSDRPRVSKLSFYTARGSLEGWLRTVLAQEYVNRYRSERRLTSLEEQLDAGLQFRAKEEPNASSGVDHRLETATEEALQSLSAEDRYILASYYLDEATLAEIARVLALHESTISRRIEKTTKALRNRIVASLRKWGMSRKEAEQALETDVRDLTFDVRARLTQAQEEGAKPVP